MIILLDGLKPVQKSKIRVMNEALGLTEFDSDVYTKEDSIKIITDALGLRDLTAETKIQYLTVVSKLLSVNKIDNVMYLEAMRLLKTVKVTKDLKEYVDKIPKLLEDEQPEVRILAGIIYYDVDEAINMDVVTKTSMIDRKTEYPYLDIINKKWVVYPDALARQEIKLCDEIVKILSDVAGKSWLLEKKGEKRRYDDIKRISETFSEVLGHPFMSVRKYAHRKEDIVAKPIKTKLIITRASENAVDVREVCSKFSNLRESSIVRYISNVLKMQERVLGRNNKLLIDRICTDSCYDKVKLMLAGENPHTAYSMISPLSRILQVQPDVKPEYYRKYMLLAKEYKILNDDVKIKNVPDFGYLLDEIKRIYDDKKVIRSIRVLFLTILHSIGQGDKDIGVMRISDYINTCIGFDEKYSYIDFDKEIWCIRSEYTKNKQGRVINLSKSYMDGLRQIYGEDKVKWMVFFEKNQNKYTTSSSLSHIFKKRMCATVTDVRASYATYIFNTATKEKGQEMAEKMGHGYRTTMVDYIKEIYDDGSDTGTDDGTENTE